MFAIYVRNYLKLWNVTEVIFSYPNLVLWWTVIMIPSGNVVRSCPLIKAIYYGIN